jgi:hypothetical protein
VFWAFPLIAGIMALVKFPSFRKTILAIVAVLALATVGYLAYDKQQTKASKQRVRVEQLEFADMRLEEPHGYRSLYDRTASNLTGRVKNDSRYTVFGIEARIQVLDCDDKSNCEVVGEEEQDIAPLIPPGQARDIDALIHFRTSIQVRGHFQWNNGTMRSPRSEPGRSLQKENKNKKDTGFLPHQERECAGAISWIR